MVWVGWGQRQAYLADVVPSERLPRFMVFREASATLAFIIGPTVGGYLTATDRASISCLSREVK